MLYAETLTPRRKNYRLTPYQRLSIFLISKNLSWTGAAVASGLFFRVARSFQTRN
jgi:hypothetical protein